MSHTVGYVLLGSAFVPAVMGWDLSRSGLKQAAQAADAAHQAAKQLTRSVVAKAAQAQPNSETALASEGEAKTATDVQDAVGAVKDALAQLTGRLAPARVAFSLALLLVVASLFALGVMSASAGPNASSGATTSTSGK